ncbi:DUF1697 domain-containing protein [Opitutus sp. ER46]|uniref:DUF1697 domain-containing protein n=1 Tax=Opitutus sp. ER46 TaxID=2161864 RepID=UPI000D30CCF0|nr:DUF1697 domain-containing protein [Opitutus sp. ER46]PTX90758.1 DUF1697 domain-containing protein [Opitutus sp. ER46]
MNTHLVFLRAVNVGGTPLAMGDLRAWLENLGFAEVRTLLQSGNVVMRGKPAGDAKLEAMLERAAAKQLALETDFFVRAPAEWREVITRNPFPKETAADPAHVVVYLLKEPPTAPQVRALQAAIAGRERVAADGRHLYAVYPDGIGRSRLTLGVIEKHLGTHGTGRNWNTVGKMAALAAE